MATAARSDAPPNNGTAAMTSPEVDPEQQQQPGRSATLHGLLTGSVSNGFAGAPNANAVLNNNNNNNNNNKSTKPAIPVKPAISCQPTATAAPDPDDCYMDSSEVDPDGMSDVSQTTSVQSASVGSQAAASSQSGLQLSSAPLGGHPGIGKSGSAFHSVGGAFGQKDGSSYRNLRDRSNRKPIQERPRQKRQTLQDMTRPLKIWLYHHRDNPYPSKSEKVQLTKSSQMTMTQVSNWFANARRRLKNTVREPDLTWAKRIKLYNNYVEGNQELLSVGSSSSDDELRDDQTEQGSEAKPDSDTQPTTSNVQECTGEQHHLSEISSNSALVDQGLKQDGNLLDRLSADTHSVPQFQPLNMHEEVNSSCNIEPMDQTPLTKCTGDSKTSSHEASRILQPAAEELRPVHVPNSTITVVGDIESGLDGGETAPKYKTNIMHRYLNDSYQSALQSLNSLGNKDLKENERHRNPSGSLSSHDYEEYMSSASSARSTPTREHQDGHVDEYEEFSRYWPDIKSRAEDDLYWKEISAALALTTLARSRYSTQSH